jgi:KaiC/GvpD/RAD55 family RecA-like ATPase
LENYGVTSLIISEYSENNDIPLEWFVTSGIIHLDNQVIENTVRQTIQIKKLRGVEHSERIHPIELDADGLHIYEAWE